MTRSRMNHNRLMTTIAFSLFCVQQGEAFLSVRTKSGGYHHPSLSFRPEAGGGSLLHKSSPTLLFLGSRRYEEDEDKNEMEKRGSKQQRRKQAKSKRSGVVAGDFDNAKDWYAGEMLAHEFYQEVRARNEEGTLDVDVVIAKNRRRMNGQTGDIVVKEYRNVSPKNKGASGSSSAASVATTTTTADTATKQAKQKRKLWPPIPASFNSPTPLTISGIVATILLTGLWLPVLACVVFVMYYYAATATMVTPALLMMGPF